MEEKVMVDHSSQFNTEEEDRPYIRGSVLHLIFRNDDNGYTVAKVKVKKAQPSVEGDTVTVVGFFPVIEPEETYEFEGSFKEHPRFGKQLQAESYRKDIPTEEEAVISYLSSDRFTGIGKKTAASIVQSLGNDAINKILDNPDVLREVQGLNEKKRTLLFDQLMENQGWRGRCSY
ncbi:ATP-dependent RecD-like DNA helicase [Thalassobacillus sp. C254]|uniref:ATP-dependent DNA helicase n=1 Tax=Thalassobacillus sp. C254 TaxID=1225341 RepID=UPI0022B60E31|nr:ATP-dependent RecD-like DNA helicase [Thalassobacillus sp. C254]